jgi:hypothetical protein
VVRLARVPAGTSIAPTRFTSEALINNFDALDGGFPRPRPRGRTSGRHTRAGFSFWRNDVPLAVSPQAQRGRHFSRVGDRVPERLGAFLLAQHSPRGRAGIGIETQALGAE